MPKRMAIISAGVIMNVIFAVLMASLAFGLGVKEMTCTISGVRTGGAAWRAGLRTGDEIVKIGDRENPIFNDLRHGVTVGDLAKGIEFTVRRPADASTRTVLLKPDTDLGVPTIGVTSPISLTLPAEFGKGLPGAAGLAKPALEPGDTVRTIDGAPVKTYAELLAELSRKPSATVTLGVDRVVEGAAKPERVEITLPPQPRRTTGITIGPARITAVQEGSPAAAAGLEAGDTIVTIAGEPAGDPLTLDDRLATFTGKPLALTVGREGQADREVTITPREVTWRDDETSGPGCRVAVSALGIALAVADVVADVAAGSPAAKAGLVAGDRLTRANLVLPGEAADAEGAPISAKDPNWPAVVAAIQQLPAGTKLALEVASAAGQARSLELEPVEADDLFIVDRGLVFDPVYEKVQARSLGEAFGRGLRKAGEDLSLVYSFLGKLWSNTISPRLLGGPIEIAKQAGKSAEEGFGRLLLFLTMLSANLAVVNFLPIPVLDGGHMVFLLYELIRGKPPSETVVGVLSYLGLALILTLMMFVFGLDLGLIPRR
ncbi:MAG: PDZ domain-containing protein [Planctomycetia bacterium]|nr:PDZ domain-containing protein [Planctomycetia bacterium]